MMSGNRRKLLGAFSLVLLLIAAVLQSKIDPQRHQFEPAAASNTNKAISQLPIEFALGTLTGFREAVAGLLWVRADEFFHNGDYESVVPIVRIITWIDPHQTDVYTTGAWHMDYNFTDEESRSDRRYIPLSIALLKEGIQNNPDDTDIASDLGFVHYYRKIADLTEAEKAFRLCQNNMLRLEEVAKQSPHDESAQKIANEAAEHTINFGHGLAHVLESMGRISEAVKEWDFCIAMHQRNLDTKNGYPAAARMALNSAIKQRYEAAQRDKWRKIMLPPLPPVDMGFSAQLVRVAPRIFVCKGTMHVIGAERFVLATGFKVWKEVDGARVDIRLNDAGYVMPVLKSFGLNSFNQVPKTTIMQDTAQVSFGKFERKIDMSMNPEIYSFDAPKYDVTVSFNPSNPQTCPADIQDRIGWLGEYMTDKHYLDKSGKIPGDIAEPVPGLHILKKTFTLTRDDILGQGRKVFD